MSNVLKISNSSRISRVCVICECNSECKINGNNDRSFFQFPKDSVQFEKWVARIGSHMDSEKFQRKNKYICDLHFAESCFCDNAITVWIDGKEVTKPRTNKRLKKNVDIVPTLFNGTTPAVVNTEQDTTPLYYFLDENKQYFHFSNLQVATKYLMENYIKKLRARCCVPGCASPSLVNHRFPKSDPGIFVSWLMQIQSDELKEMTHEEIQKRVRVCDRHFRGEDKIHNPKRLKSTAIPMLYLPENLEQFPNGPVMKSEMNPATSEKSCRTCAKTSVNYYSIHSNINNSASTLRNVIVLLVPQMEKVLHKEDIVCESCQELLMQCARFIDKCLCVESDRTTQKASEDNFNTENFKYDGTSSVAVTDNTFCNDIISHSQDIDQKFKDNGSLLIEDFKSEIFDDEVDPKEHQIIPDLDNEIPQICHFEEIPYSVPNHSKLISVSQLTSEQLNKFTDTLASNNVNMLQFSPNLVQTTERKRIILVGSAFKCQKCSLHFDTEKKYARHLNSHKRMERKKRERLKLKKLKKEKENSGKILNFPTKRDRSKEKANLVCKICLVRFTSKDDREVHLKLHPPYICEKCGKGFSTSSSLAVHKEVHNDPNTFICEVCGKGYRFQAALRVHRRIHENKTYACGKCSKVFKTHLCLRSHSKRAHPEGPIKLFPCRICDKVFKSSGNLSSHYRVMHLKDEAYKCERCGKGFGRSDYLLRHKRRHTILDKKPRLDQRYLAYDKKYVAVEGGYQCPICEKVLKSKLYLKRHILGHGSLSRFSCKYCDMTFKVKFQRNNHEKLHETSDLKFRCGICWRRFENQEELDQHSSTHNNLKYKCESCDQSFARKHLLDDHFVKSHVDDKDVEEEARALLIAAGFQLYD